MHFFDLVEKDPNANHIIAKISGKAFGIGTVRITHFEMTTGQKFTNNINLMLQVEVDYHNAYGLSLILTNIDTNFTIGRLQQQRDLTLQKLVNENSFITKVNDQYQTTNKKLSLNLVIQHIALISSTSSAGAEDFKHSLENNPFNYKFQIDEYFAMVQGNNNHQQFFERIIDVYKSGIKYDAVVITRGGGAQTDFLLFDNYRIAKAVAKFPIPIITGIGHQKNTTIVDLMAHTQTKTPTQAAEFIIEHNQTFEKNLSNFQKNIIIKSQQRFNKSTQNLTT